MIPGCWYTVQQILAIIPKDDIIFVDGLSFTPNELTSEFNIIRLRYHHSETQHNTTYHMFTMFSVYV